ncbi:hypothetical protein [Cupriavidus sp. TMH.W2]|uniref:hypothetical protein n=1 Tax=Cupriavidus sp. TMH.W2 TaxID=3434465 RepID=UPI003D7703F3
MATIDLNTPGALSLKSVADLLASGDDSTHTQLRVSSAGIASLSKTVGNVNTGGLAFRLETWTAGNGYVGQAAAADAKWVKRVHDVLQANWPTPSSTYIDYF